MTNQRTFADEHRFLFTSDVLQDDVRTFVTVHWTGLPFIPDDSFLRPLRTYLSPRHEVAEVWLVFPEDLEEIFKELRQVDRFPTHDSVGAPVLYRLFSVDLSGALREQEPTPKHALACTPDVANGLIADGLRQLFSDTGALAAPTAGYHFTHPSGVHSGYFIRASQAVSRQQHAFFVAMGLLSVIRAPQEDATLWVDTAGISTVGYAFAILAQRLGASGTLRVETFGGYEGLSERLHPSASDIVLISGSTSGSLARKAVADKKLTPARVITLFYLGKLVPPPVDGAVLCDVTYRDASPEITLRESRIQPYETAHSEADCEHCIAGSGSFILEGDSFFPAATVLDLRMPSLLDRPKTGVRPSPVDFDGDDYFNELFGLDAIVFDGGSHGVGTRLDGLLASPPDTPAMQHLIARLGDAVGDGTVKVVLSLQDAGSIALGRFVAARFFKDESWAAPGVDGAPWRAWYAGEQPDLRSAADGGTVVVCAAVIASGRLLTSVSRELRDIGATFDTAYFVGAAHPASSTTWSTLTKTLKRRSTAATSPLTEVWRIPREPRSPGSPTPWTREVDLLGVVAAALVARDDYDEIEEALQPRLQQLQQLDSNTLFVGAVSGGGDHAIAPLNPGFALWSREWTKHPQAETNGAVPTHAEIYATVAHYLYESRRHNFTIDHRVISSRRHGYALNPAIFDRFNDPVIQAAILRAAEPAELRYETDKDASRAVADLVQFVLTNLHIQAGNAAYEFLLALAEAASGRPNGLRIHAESLRQILDEADRLYGKGFDSIRSTAPRTRALLLYLETSVARSQ